MKIFIIAFRNSFRKRGNNIIKIISLGIGLSVGLVLTAKIIFELSFNKFYPDNERIYQIYSNYSFGDGEIRNGEKISGAVAWAMGLEIPEIECATRFTPTWNDHIYTENKEYLYATSILADENWFDVLYRPVLTGDAKKILKLPMHCLVSKTLADKIDKENVVGKVITIEHYPDNQLTVAGVFEDIPENATHKYDVVISLKSIGAFTWDGSENWLGNDRYFGFVKLAPNIKPESLEKQMIEIQERHVDKEFLVKTGTKVSHFLVNIKDIHTFENINLKMFILILGILSCVLFATAILNYTLVVISSLVNRTKEIAVHKCYGASTIHISKLMFAETFIHLLLALLLSAVTILLFKDMIEKLLETTLHGLFAPPIIILLSIVCTAVFIISGFFPAYLFSKIKVTAAFQKIKESHRKWKIVLIFFEVTASAFLISLLIMIGSQYKNLIHADQGYSFENLLFVPDNDNDAATRNNIVQELEKMSEIKAVALCSNLPYWGASGNNVYETGGEKELFNIADLYFADQNFMSVMEIQIIDGDGFIDGKTETQSIMVSQSFVDRITECAGWTDGVVGKSIMLTEHGISTICGVFKNINLSSDGFKKDTRPAVISYNPEVEHPVFLIKTYKITPKLIEDIYAIFVKHDPETKINVFSYEESFKENFSSFKTLQSGFIICSIVSLFIALIGLIGYINDETNRRRSEIAIRKINGASVKDIQSLFLTTILKPVIPAILTGIIASVLFSKYLQNNFVEKVHIPLFIYLLCAICITSIILAAVSINSYKASIRNPRENISNE
jgi:putative ABC transport system permease protein